MSFKGGLAGGSGSALYGPRISRSLVDQLESHLRTLGAPATDPVRDRKGDRTDGSAPPAVPHARRLAWTAHGLRVAVRRRVGRCARLR